MAFWSWFIGAEELLRLERWMGQFQILGSCPEVKLSSASPELKKDQEGRASGSLVSPKTWINIAILRI